MNLVPAPWLIHQSFHIGSLFYLREVHSWAYYYLVQAHWFLQFVEQICFYADERMQCISIHRWRIHLYQLSILSLLFSRVLRITMTIILASQGTRNRFEYNFVRRKILDRLYHQKSVNIIYDQLYFWEFWEECIKHLHVDYFVADNRSNENISNIKSLLLNYELKSDSIVFQVVIQKCLENIWRSFHTNLILIRNVDQ